MHFGLALLAASALAFSNQPQQGLVKAVQQRGLAREQISSPHNVLIVLADDLGIDALQMYGLNPDAPSTPNLDQLAMFGIRFENAWASPSCTPTRAMLQTGQYGCRLGIGASIETGSVSLKRSQNNLANRMRRAGYSTAAFGKWHLTAPGSVLANCTPLTEGGYRNFFGSLRQELQYCSWTGVRGSVSSSSRKFQICNDVSESVMPGYMTTMVIDEAIGWAWRQSRNWFSYLAPQAPYSIYHVPPSELHSQILTGSICSHSLTEYLLTFYAALQALDTKIGDLLATLGPNWVKNTTIIFLGDNGNPVRVNDEIGYWPAGTGKETLFEAGIRVPFVIAGKAVSPALWGQSSPLLVHAVDVYSTVVELAGGSLPESGVDGKSLVPILNGQSTNPVHDFLYADYFVNSANPPAPEKRSWAMRNTNFKLIHMADGTELFYNLAIDPRESNNLGAPQPLQPGYASYLRFKSNVPIL